MTLEARCMTRWRQVEDAIKKQLPADESSIKNPPTCDELIASLRQKEGILIVKGFPAFMLDVETAFMRVQHCADCIVASIQPSLHLSTVWGVLNLVITAAVTSSDMLSQIAGKLDDMGHELLLIEKYAPLWRSIDENNPVILDAFVDFMLFWINAVEYLGHSPKSKILFISWIRAYKWEENPLRPGWIAEFDPSVGRTRNRVQQARDVAAAEAVLRESQIQLSVERKLEQLDARFRNRLVVSDIDSHVETEGAITVSIPQNQRFQHRDGVMNQVRSRLTQIAEEPKFQSMALWGLGGIGKTQTALAYAYERIADGLQAVFWVDSQTRLQLLQGYTDIAVALNIEGAVKDAPLDANRDLVKTWFRKTRVPWLMILDNVENPGDLEDFWPTTHPSSQGSILITSRNDILASDPAAGGFELPTLGPEDGQQFLLRTIDRAAYNEAESEAAMEMSVELGGLPLALNLMAAQIRNSRMSISRFLEKYREDSHKSIHKAKTDKPSGSRYAHTIDTVWRTSFGSLDADSLVLLGIICLLHPDDIPEALFTQLKPSLLPESLSFCKDFWTYKAVVRPIVGNSIIREDPETECISVHRVLQYEFRRWSGPDQIESSFRAASKLLVEAFPRQVNGVSLRNEGIACRRYIQQALALCDRQKEYGIGSDSSTAELEEFTELLTNCAWWLLETGEYQDSMYAVETAFRVCRDKESLWYAHLCNSAGLIHCERTLTDKAFMYYDQTLKIRENLLPKDHPEMANILNNYGNTILTEHKDEHALTRALKYYDKAYAIDLTMPWNERRKIVHLRLGTFGWINTWLGNYDEATKFLRMAQDSARENFGEGTHWDGNFEYKLGNVKFEKGDLEGARQSYNRALAIFLKENKRHFSVSTTRFKLACVDIKEGMLDQAIETLRQTVAMCEYNEIRKGDKGETARVTRKLAEALEKKGEREDAEKLKASAEGMRREIQGDRFASLPDNDASYRLMVYFGFW